MPEKILVVEDDRTLLETLEYNLARREYRVYKAMDGPSALQTARRELPDLVLLDLMLPGLDGLKVCRILRQEMNVPILILTARTGEVDKVMGLEMGADDYMTKPFSMRELLARVRAMFRRATMINPQTVDEQQLLVTNDLEIDTARHHALLGSKELELTPKEFDLLAFLVKNKGCVFSREQFLERVWGYDYAVDTRTVDVHIRWLRQKIETDPANPRRSTAVRGAGYKIDS